MPLHPKDQKTLLRFARKVLEDFFSDPAALKKPGWVRTVAGNFSLPENENPGIFVTLTRAGALRGCIGTLLPDKTLSETLAAMTLKSALEDPRFGPLKAAELAEIEIEISALSPLARAGGAADIREGLHGVLVRKGSRTGLFLPQVWEDIPDKNSFLSELCQGKAGLAPDAWKDPETELWTFTAEHFSESAFRETA